MPRLVVIFGATLLFAALIWNVQAQFIGGFFPWWWSRWCNGIWCPFGTRCVFSPCVQFPCIPASFCAPFFWGVG